MFKIDLYLRRTAAEVAPSTAAEVVVSKQFRILAG